MTEYLYVDASAVVKRYRDEVGRDEAVTAMDAASGVVSSRLTYVEVGRAIQAITDDDDLTLLNDWNAAWAQHQVIEVDDEIVAHALSLACYHGLRSSDAVQLASALTLKVPMRFATWDARLWEAARAVGLRVVPTTKPGLPAPA